MHLRGEKRIEAFRDVSFSLEEGEFLGVSGPSGSGKSSLLKCVYRTYLPSVGAVWYTERGGRTLDLASADDNALIELRRQEIGYISQFFPVIPRVSALDTIVGALVSRGRPRGEGKALAMELLDRLGIHPSLWDAFPSTFSGGEKQRINIITAVISRPRLLLLDEPTASLDAASAHEAVSLIRELKEGGTAMIGVFHDEQILGSLSDKRLTMSAGRQREVVA
jgi:alpha-D-ribose 1-methylphosphonate 5-triphosphate synthase subunit PhnL